MKKIIKHSLEIYKKPTKWNCSKDKFYIKEKNIVAENTDYLILDDKHFTKICKKHNTYSSAYFELGKRYINFKNCLSEQGIFFTLYSSSKMRKSTIIKKVMKEAKKEYGYLFSEELDFSILDTMECNNENT